MAACDAPLLAYRSVAAPKMKTLSMDNSNTSISDLEQETVDSEPLQDEEAAQFRARVLEMGILSSETSNLVEKELAKMVLRLTESSRPSSAQVVSQASMITDLSLQRNYLIEQAEEERARWESERGGWERASEALIAQRNKINNYSNSQQYLDRFCSVLQAENIDLRNKEARLLKRLSCLEEEMVKLKPVLLLQSFPDTVSGTSLAHTSAYLANLPYPAASGREAVSARRAKVSRKKEKSSTNSEMERKGAHENVTADHEDKESVESDLLHLDANNKKTLPTEVQEPDDSSGLAMAARIEEPGTLLLQPQSVSLPPTSPSLPSDVAVISIPPSAVPKLARNERESGTTAMMDRPLAKLATPLTSDARTEHLLLAARMIGRRRAAVVAGIVDSERDRKQESELAEKAKGRKDRRKSAHSKSSAVSGAAEGKGKETLLTRSSNAPDSKAKRSSPITTRRGKGRTSGVSQLGEGLSGEVGSSAQRSRRRRASSSSSAQLARTTQLTGMDSLLSAARSMMDSGSELQKEDPRKPDGRKASTSGAKSGAGSRRPSSTVSDDTEMLPPTRKRKSDREPDDTEMHPPTKKRKGDIGDQQSERSALDVLADQAAVASSTGASRKGKSRSKSTEEKEEGAGVYQHVFFVSEDANDSTQTRTSRRSVSTRSRRSTPRLITAPDGKPSNPNSNFSKHGTRK